MRAHAHKPNLFRLKANAKRYSFTPKKSCKFEKKEKKIEKKEICWRPASGQQCVQLFGGSWVEHWPV